MPSMTVMANLAAQSPLVVQLQDGKAHRADTPAQFHA